MRNRYASRILKHFTNEKRVAGRAILLPTLAVLPLLAGCHVPQQAGGGRAVHRTEPVTHRPYWLYTPAGYTVGKRADGRERRYPLVVSFHGMRPFDDYGAHVRQWQEEADRHGFIVCAPRLGSCDVLGRFPIDDPESKSLQADARAVLAMIDEVCRSTQADREQVLATSFSSGGYIAHYMVNRYPDRFSCLAVFQSNFAAATLEPRQVGKYRHYPVAIINGENDLKLVRRECTEAAQWYRRHGFRNLVVGRLPGRGHERTPEIVADIFAAQTRPQPAEPAPLLFSTRSPALSTDSVERFSRR